LQPFWKSLLAFLQIFMSHIGVFEKVIPGNKLYKTINIDLHFAFPLIYLDSSISIVKAVPHCVLFTHYIWFHCMDVPWFI
jgi:hypothetical protein